MQGRMGCWVRYVVVGLVVLMSAGCASRISTNQQLSGNEGAVVLRFITNEAELHSPVKALFQVNLQRVYPPEDVDIAGLTLARTRAVTHGSAIFSGTLKPGRYKVLSASGVVGGYPYNYSYRFPLGATIDTFEVHKGEVTLLGTVLVQPTQGSRFRLGYLPPDAELMETFERLFPAMAQQTRGRPFHSLEMTPELNQAHADAPKMKRLSYAVNGLWQSDKGDFFAGSRMGKILWKRVSETHWREFDVGSWREVLSVRPYAGGVLAAGEEGLLRHSVDEGKTWVALTPPDGGLIYAIEPMEQNKLLAVVRHGDIWSAYLTDDARLGGWRKVGVLVGEEPAIAALRTVGLAAADAAENALWPPGVVVRGNTVGLMLRDGAFHLLDIATGQVEHLPTKLMMHSLAALPDGTLLLRGQGFGDQPSTLLSADGGRSWNDLWASGVAAFANSQRGFVARKSSLSMTVDTGKTWTLMNGDIPWLPAELRTLTVDRLDGSLVAVLFGGRIFRSVDQGKSWKRER